MLFLPINDTHWNGSRVGVHYFWIFRTLRTDIVFWFIFIIIVDRGFAPVPLPVCNILFLELIVFPFTSTLPIFRDRQHVTSTRFVISPMHPVDETGRDFSANSAVTSKEWQFFLDQSLIPGRSVMVKWLKNSYFIRTCKNKGRQIFFSGNAVRSKGEFYYWEE